MSTMRTVPFGPDMQEHATLLLAAADDLEMDPGVVRTTSGAFVVPQDVLDKAGLADEAEPLDEDEGSHDGNSEEPQQDPKPAKKAASKRAAKKASQKPASEE